MLFKSTTDEAAVHFRFPRCVAVANWCLLWMFDGGDGPYNFRTVSSAQTRMLLKFRRNNGYHDVALLYATFVWMRSCICIYFISRRTAITTPKKERPCVAFSLFLNKHGGRCFCLLCLNNSLFEVINANDATEGYLSFC